jgi:hypothetical protein
MKDDDNNNLHDNSPRTPQPTADGNKQITFDQVMDYMAYPEKYLPSLPSFPSMAAFETTSSE